MNKWLTFAAITAGFSVSAALADPSLPGGQQGFGTASPRHRYGYGPQINVDLGPIFTNRQPTVCETVRHLCGMHYGPDEAAFGDCMWRHQC